jgi:hypothetical protein
MEPAIVAKFCWGLRLAYTGLLRVAYAGLLRVRRLGHPHSRVIASDPCSIVYQPVTCPRSLQNLAMRTSKRQYERQADRSK